MQHQHSWISMGILSQLVAIRTRGCSVDESEENHHYYCKTKSVSQINPRTPRAQSHVVLHSKKQLRSKNKLQSVIVSAAGHESHLAHGPQVLLPSSTPVFSSYGDSGAPPSLKPLALCSLPWLFPVPSQSGFLIHLPLFSTLLCTWVQPLRLPLASVLSSSRIQHNRKEDSSWPSSKNLHSLRSWEGEEVQGRWKGRRNLKV